jgi:hypothetical protein
MMKQASSVLNGRCRYGYVEMKKCYASATFEAATRKTS